MDNHENILVMGPFGDHDTTVNCREEKKEQLYEAWKDFEKRSLSDRDLDWIRSRYTVDDSVNIKGGEFDYICFIPKEFLL